MTTDTRSHASAAAPASPRGALARRWDVLSPWPGGRWLFSKALGRMAPYTGSIDARVEDVIPGYARARIHDRPRLRQHLGSVHAAALFNLSEMVSALALMYALPADARAIPFRLEIDYLKKSRGVLTAEGRAPILTTPEEGRHQVEVEVRDRSGEVTARVVAHWLVRPTAPRVGRVSS
ncbi:MAG: DUF4442 domain-containing protein [Acidobacteriota bacterium]